MSVIFSVILQNALGVDTGIIKERDREVLYFD